MLARSTILLAITGSWIHYFATAYAPVCNQALDGEAAYYQRGYFYSIWFQS